MNTKKSKSNNLICLDIAGEKSYYTSTARAGKKIGLASCSVSWAMAHNNVLKTNTDKEVKLYIVDGTNIPYGLINND